MKGTYGLLLHVSQLRTRGRTARELLIDVRVESNPPSSCAGALVELSGTAYWRVKGTESLDLLGPVREPSGGAALPARGVIDKAFGSDPHVRREGMLAVAVGADTLAAVEEARAGSPIELSLFLVAKITKPSGGYTAMPVAIRGDGIVALSVHEWCELLASWGMLEAVSLTVPLRRGGDGTFEEAWNALRKARAATANGDHRGAVAMVRDAAERLCRDRPAPAGTAAARLGKPERYATVARALANLTGGAHHTDVISATEWERRDADAAVAMLAALLQAW